MSNGFYDWSHACSYAHCPKCNALVALRVGLDARFHDRVRFQCPGCTAESVVTIVMRGARPSPMYASDPILAERVE